MNSLFLSVPYQRLEVFPAHGFIAIVTPNFDLISAGDGIATFVESDNEVSLAPAVTYCFEFKQLVGPRQQVMAAFECLSEEVGAKTISQYRDIQFIDHFNELRYLCFGKELGFINKHAVERFFVVE